jgi:NAD(P)-dependent dehydrogenase (short-subunit alcohol dehydrogenase family)
MLQFHDKVCMVTGAGSGIGRATAVAFSSQGAVVIVADVNEESAEETVRQIHTSGGEALFVQADVSKAKDVERLANTTLQAYGRLDCAFNNAGISGARASIGEYPDDVWNRVIAVDLTSVFLCMKYEIPQMLRQGRGAVVNMSSILGLVASGQGCAYAAAKHGVVGLTKDVARECVGTGVRVNAVCPGSIETPLTLRAAAAMAREAVDEYLNSLPAKRRGKPEEVAEAVLWLCSDAASYVNGHAMVIDGAFTAR